MVKYAKSKCIVINNFTLEFEAEERRDWMKKSYKGLKGSKRDKRNLYETNNMSSRVPQ